ncbi:MAG: winged helix-turn-helix transcriptional regulator [Dehalococcoidales bacterium]|nr:winged helix-turn-helix transcriptional regulator [Dehalococcoidales bacterium]
MIEVLRNKNLTTKFQILAEIADRGPDIQQREIAKNLDITPQAVSDYIAQLIKENMLISKGRSSYKITNEGVNWVIKELKELNNYSISIQRAVNNISVCAAIAETPLKRGQKAGLKMKDGLLYASADDDAAAAGITTTAAGAGEDVGITDIVGIVALQVGIATILKVPGIENGGSGSLDKTVLKKYLKACDIVISIGLESFAALNRAGIEFYRYGSAEVAIEAARCGLNPLVVCVENEASRLVSRLEQGGIKYELVDASKG